MTLPDLLFPVMGSVFLAGLVQGLSGFGSALVAVPLLALLLPIETVVPLMALLAIGITAVNLWHVRHALRAASLYRLLAGYLIGTPLGLYFLVRAPEALVLGLLGLFIGGYAALALTGRHPQWDWLRTQTMGLGTVSGALGAAFSTNGPPVILHVAAHRDWSPDRQKATLSGFFLASSLITVSAHALGGLITPGVLEWGAWSLVPLALGTLSGIRLYTRLGEHDYKRIVFSLVLLMGVLLLGRSLWII